jgi:hypothetical protein
MTDVPPTRADSARDDAALWAAAPVDHESVSNDIEVVFRRQPKPVEARHRVAYRTALLVLVLSRFNKGAAKLMNLHTIMWAMRSSRTRRMFSAWWNGRRSYNTVTERLDPDLQVTFNLALVDGVVAPAANGSRVVLTDKGQELSRLIDEQSQLLAVEKSFLGEFARLSDASMERALGQVLR